MDPGGWSIGIVGMSYPGFDRPLFSDLAVKILKLKFAVLLDTGSGFSFIADAAFERCRANRAN